MSWFEDLKHMSEVDAQEQKDGVTVSELIGWYHEVVEHA